MGVLRQLSRHVVIDDGLDPLDVETPRGKIGRKQVIDLPVLEFLQGVEALWCGL